MRVDVPAATDYRLIGNYSATIDGSPARYAYVALVHEAAGRAATEYMDSGAALNGCRGAPRTFASCELEAFEENPQLGFSGILPAGAHLALFHVAGIEEADLRLSLFTDGVVSMRAQGSGNGTLLLMADETDPVPGHTVQYTKTVTLAESTWVYFRAYRLDDVSRYWISGAEGDREFVPTGTAWKTGDQTLRGPNWLLDPGMYTFGCDATFGDRTPPACLVSIVHDPYFVEDGRIVIDPDAPQ